MRLPFGINISFDNNGKYIKKEDCNKKHQDFKAYLDCRLKETIIDRNQKLIELKSDLIEHIDIKIQILRDLIVMNIGRGK